ncbi:MAG: ATP-binding cassette domain-containing protein [Mycoplasmoidaceae bacterium]|nr:ATP-binding cassette domain-containing protein [Mycoplasmoidaceae bacterium]
MSKFKEKLDYPVDQRGRNFSGGQKQRLCIARALVRKPKIFIMDDSTSALDLITEAKVQDNIRKNYKDATTIVVSQRVASIKNASKIIVMDNGLISGIGTHKELVKSNETYRNIVKSQLGEEGLK